MQKLTLGTVALTMLLLSVFSPLAARSQSGQPPAVHGGERKVEQVSIISAADGVTLHGSLWLPGGAGLFPAVVLLPDLGAEYPTTYDGALLSSLTDSLVQQGVAVLRLDERGTGKSGGTLGQTSLATRLADVAAALNKLRTHSQVDSARIGLVGHGRGGNVALLAGAQPLPPTFIVAIAASGVSGQETLAAQVPMYGKVFSTDYDQLERQRQQVTGQMLTRQVAFQMRSKGASPVQVQAYTDQQASKLQKADRKWEAALRKHQHSMLEIVRQMSDNGQARAVLLNMMRQRYPRAPAEELQRSVQRMTSAGYRDYLMLDPKSRLSAVKCPVLLVQGMADSEVNPTVSLEVLLKGLNGSAKASELRLKDLDHNLRFAAKAATSRDKNLAPVAPGACQEIGRWIKEVN